MNRIKRAAVLGAALCIVAVSFTGCRDEKNISEKFAIISESTDKALSLESGEILVYGTVKAEKDIDGIVKTGSIETYIRFSNGPETPDFELEATESSTEGDPIKHEFVKSGDMLLEFTDGVGGYASDAPDIFETFRLMFDADDIESVEVTPLEKGVKAYKLTMTKAFSNTFDQKADGANYDCKVVTYCYYINSAKTLSNITREITYSLSVDGKTQTVIEFTDAKIQ